MAGPRFNTKGEQVKKKPKLKMPSTGRATKGEKVLVVNKPKPVEDGTSKPVRRPLKKANMRKKPIKIVQGFKGLIKERKKRIEGATK